MSQNFISAGRVDLPAHVQSYHPPYSPQVTGKLGEAIALSFLRSQGYELCAQNWRYGKIGELDLVVSLKHTYVGVEVKTRHGLDFGHPFDSIHRVKTHRMGILLQQWARLQLPPAFSGSLRLDAISVVLSSGKTPLIDHIAGIE